MVERVHRTETGTCLRERVVAQLDAVVRLASVGVPLPLGEGYREVFGEGLGVVPTKAEALIRRRRCRPNPPPQARRPSPEP